MKILNLYFKNINSLEGENRIDFEQPPFTDSGVFAITGPNGSGKSSILDAITLALYGETFRFDKPAQHVITKHTAESFSQIEFMIGADKYRSSWHVKREGDNPKANLLPTEMNLLRLNNIEEIVATSQQQVCNRMAEITGMNFRSFTRSILLAQGDFAAFLNALDNERMAILEKIISADIYADYQKAITDKLADAERKLLFLNQDLAAVPLIEPQSLEACELDLADFSEQAADYRETINNLRQQKILLEKVDDIKNQISKQESALQKAITQQLAAQKKLDQLTAGENAEDFRADIETILENKQALELETKQLTVLQNELKQLQSTLALPGFDVLTASQLSELPNKTESISEQKQTIDSLKSQVALFNANWQSEIVLQKTLADQLTEKQGVLTEVTAWLEEHADDQTLVTNFPDLERLKTVRILLDELTEKRKALGKWSKYTNAALQKNKDAIESKANKRYQLNQKLEAEQENLEEISQGYSLEQLEGLEADQKERVKAYQELVNLSFAYEKLSPRPSLLFRLFGKEEGPIRDEKELETELQNLREQIKRDENIRLSLEKAMYNDALLARMAPERHILVDGKPCPLCGATEHPYSKRPPALANSQQALLDQRIKIKRLNVEIVRLEQQLTNTQKRAERNHANQNQLQQFKSRWLTLCNQLNIASEDLDIRKTGIVKELLNTESTDLKNLALLIGKYKASQKRIERLKTVVEKNVSSVEQLQSSIQTIEAEWQTAPQKIADTESDFARVQQEEQALMANLSDQLSQLGENLPAQGKEDGLAERLNLRRQDYESYALRKRNLTEEIAVLIAKQDAGNAQIASYKDRLDQFNTQLHTEEVIALHLAVSEKQKLLADKEQQVNRLKSEASLLDEVVAKKMVNTQFSNIEEISLVLVALSEQPKLIQEKEELDNQITNLGKQLEALHSQLEKLESDLSLELTVEDIQPKIKAAQEKMELAQLEAQRLERIVREQKQYKEKQAAILSQIEKQQQAVAQASAEAAEISAENGMAFRRRVQQQVVAKLLSQTNAMLEKISGRYYLRQRPSERGLSLVVEDTYQGNVRRLPKTLSGGESFIVSLALALALSELANNGRSVDSLFLDEGFGNLDAESLYTVVNTLEGLRAHGKTVGVISHVEAVQKRFKAQLQLVKKPNGLGELRKVS